MSKIPGTFNGTRYPDLRVLIPQHIRAYYQERGTWEKIVGYRSYEQVEVITVKIPGGRRKDKWRIVAALHSMSPWYLADDEFLWDFKK